MPKTSKTPAVGTVRGSDRYDRSGQRDYSEATSHPASRVCRTPRVATELLAELAAQPGMEPVVRSALERFCALLDDALAVTGGDRFPPTPLHEVQP